MPESLDTTNQNPSHFLRNLAGLVVLVLVVAAAWYWFYRSEKSNEGITVLEKARTVQELVESRRAPSQKEILEFTGVQWPLPDDAVIFAYDYDEQPAPHLAAFYYLTAVSSEEVFQAWRNYAETENLTIQEDEIDTIVFRSASDEVTAVVISSGQTFGAETAVAVVMGLTLESYPTEINYYRNFFTEDQEEIQE